MTLSRTFFFSGTVICLLMAGAAFYGYTIVHTDPTSAVLREQAVKIKSATIEKDIFGSAVYQSLKPSVTQHPQVGQTGNENPFNRLKR